MVKKWAKFEFVQCTYWAQKSIFGQNIRFSAQYVRKTDFHLVNGGALTEFEKKFS